MPRLLHGFLALMLAAGCGTARPSREPAPSPARDGIATAARVIPSDIPFASLEGPLWVPEGGYLLFSDVVERNGPAARIYKLDPATRRFSTLDYPGAPVTTNGLASAGDGALIACERWNGALVRVARGTRTVLADRSPAGMSLNAPNDVAVRRDGNIYFTDTTWGARPETLAKTAVYRLSPGGVLYVAFETDMPNGVALSPDGHTLYVGSDAHDRLWQLPVDENGRVGEAAPFAGSHLARGARLHVPDGICVDDLGRLYVANNSSDVSALVVLAPDGSFVGRVPIPAPPSNCTFGGPERRTLYVTTLHAIYEARSATPGLP